MTDVEFDEIVRKAFRDMVKGLTIRAAVFVGGGLLARRAFNKALAMKAARN